MRHSAASALRLAIGSADGSARSVRAIEKITGARNERPVDCLCVRPAWA
ncbi:MAG: hypothetical protein ACYC5X_04210 [Syntrophales bacterium]